MTRGKDLQLSYLIISGPQFFEAAAKCLFRVIKIYPDPMQLLTILEQSTPPPVFAILMDLMAAEMRPGAAQAKPENESKIEDIVE